MENLVLSISNGFGHLDTADLYTTHPEIAEAIKRSGIPREDIFITTKYNPGIDSINASFKSAAESVDEALKEIGVDYIDLFLIHSPFIDPVY